MTFKISSIFPPKQFCETDVCPLAYESFSALAEQAHTKASDIVFQHNLYHLRQLNPITKHENILRLIHDYCYNGNIFVDCRNFPLTEPFLVALVESGYPNTPDKGSSALFDYAALRKYYKCHKWKECLNPMTREPIRSIHIYAITTLRGALPLLDCTTVERFQASKAVLSWPGSPNQPMPPGASQSATEFLNQFWLFGGDYRVKDHCTMELISWIEKNQNSAGLLKYCSWLFRDYEFMHVTLNRTFYDSPDSPHFNLVLASQHYEQALLRCQPTRRDRGKILCFLGFNYWNQGLNQKAIASFQEAWHLVLEERIATQIMELYLEERCYKEALEWAPQTHTLSPMHHHRRRLLCGEAYRGLGMDALAQQCLLESLKLSKVRFSGAGRAYANLGLISQRKGELVEAGEYCFRAERESNLLETDEKIVKELVSEVRSFLFPTAVLCRPLKKCKLS